MERSQSDSKILIVDDNPKNLQVLGKTLQKENYAIEFAISGPAALEWLKNEKFDLVLLDINMPGMDGFEVCSNIRSEPEFDHLPVIFLTADADKKSILKGFGMGAQDYVTKPFDSKELVMRVKTHLSLKKSRESLEELNSVLEEKVLERTRQLNEVKEKAEASDRLKTAFLNNISHEIRTPLSGILGFGQLIINPDLTMDEKKKHLGMLNMSGDRLLQTINNYMDISLIVSGNQKVKTGEVDADELLNSLYGSFIPECEAKGLKMTLSGPEQPKILKFKSDRGLLHKALSHVIRNSIKFTDEGSISIGYKKEKDNTLFFAKDTGIGIESGARDKIFNLFMQADNSSNRNYEGSGLGLSIARGYIELLGGEIGFESEKNKGTVFYISLPINNRKEL
ncbi:MAG: hybrid sensor histidine kinase/response regulator [Bacteroidales bacterium]